MSQEEALKILDAVVADFPFASVESSESAREKLVYLLGRYVEVPAAGSAESGEELVANRFAAGGEHHNHDLNLLIGELAIPSGEGVWLGRLPHGKKRFLDFDLGGSFDLEGDA